MSPSRAALASVTTLLAIATLGACSGDPSPGPSTGDTSSSIVDEDQDGFSPDDGDCNDADPTVHPGADEVPCDNVDNDCNGQIDDGVAGWQQTRAERDSDGDGVPDGAIDRTFRSDGQPLTEAQSYVNPDFQDFEWAIEWFYAQDQVTEKVRTGRDPYDESYLTDDQGRVIRTEVDTDSDDVLDSIVEVEYDDRDRIVLARTDSDADGTVDFIRSWTFDGDRQVGQKTDQDADGNWDTRFEEDRGIDDRLEQTRLDNDDDPDWDVVMTYVYDSKGALLRTEKDSDGDGKVDEIESFTNNDDGLPTRAETDLGADGVVDSLWERDYDEGGNTTHQRADYEADGEWDALWEGWDHGADGNAWRTRSDDQADGTWDREWWYTYDRDRQTSIRYDADGNGTPDSVFEWDYDEDLRLIHDRYDLRNDGVWDQENWYTWSCGG